MSKVLTRALRTMQTLIFSEVNQERSFRKVVIVADLSRNNGIAMGAKYQIDLLNNLGINVSMLDFSRCNDKYYLNSICEGASLFIFHCGAPETVFFLRPITRFARSAYRIAYWAWELPDPEPGWKKYDALVHEIWTPSHFSRASISKLSSKNIHVVPHFVRSKTYRRKQNHDIFKVLVMADSRSSFSRKNPAGAIRAFQLAFRNESSAHLIIKLSGRDKEVNDFINRMNILNFKNITVVRSILALDDIKKLYESVDVMLSLHRSEGFGLPMLEAMACGTPVVATNWSGNTDFLNYSNGYPVDFKLVKVEDDYGIYANSTWADPDVEMAAAILKNLSQFREKAEEMSVSCFEYVKKNYPSLPLNQADRDRYLSQLLGLRDS